VINNKLKVASSLIVHFFGCKVKKSSLNTYKFGYSYTKEAFSIHVESIATSAASQASSQHH